MAGSGLLSAAVAAAVAAAALTPQGPGDPAVVRGVFFFSPTCPHCHTVMSRDLPPLEARWGATLELAYVDVTTPTGARLYQAAVDRFRIPRDRVGVPAVFLAGRHLVGSGEIPAVLPGLVEESAARGGTEWPDIPGLAESLADLRRATATAAPPPSDPVGLTLGALVFLSLLGAVGYAGRRAIARGRDAGPGPVRTRGRTRRLPAPDGMLAGLATAGLGIAAYLSWTALTGSETVCGPVGACGAVHASRFSTLAGIPVAVLGVGFFAAVLILALRPGGRGAVPVAALRTLCWGGALFSLYLTAAELFAIGAVCSWCLTSALISAALLVRVAARESGAVGAPARAG